MSAQPDAPWRDIIALALCAKSRALAGAGSSALFPPNGAGLRQSIVWRNGLVVMKWQPVGGRAKLGRGVRQRVYAFIATIATSVRFFAFSFLMTLRTWTFSVLKHIFNS